MKRLVCAALILVAASSARAQDWPQFRGASARGVVEGRDTPTTWNVETGENVAWKTPIPGLAHSSPIVVGERVFVTTAVRKEGDAELSSLYGSPGYGAGESVEDEGPASLPAVVPGQEHGRGAVEADGPRGRAQGQAPSQVDPRQLDARGRRRERDRLLRCGGPLLLRPRGRAEVEGGPGDLRRGRSGLRQGGLPVGLRQLAGDLREQGAGAVRPRGRVLRRRAPRWPPARSSGARRATRTRPGARRPSTRSRAPAARR